MTADRKKILFISHSAQLNGSEKVLAQLVEGLDEDRFSSLVVLPEHGPLERRLQSKGIRCLTMSLQEWISYAASLRVLSRSKMRDNIDALSEIIKDEKVDLVHTNTSIIAEGAIAAFRNGIPHVWHLHEFLEGHPSLVTRFPIHLTYRMMDLLSDALVTVSEKLRDSICSQIETRGLHVICNGIAVPPESGTGIVLRGKKLPPNTIVVTTIGHILEEKGHDIFMQAALEVIRHHENVVFLIAGKPMDERLSAHLRQQIHLHGLQRRFFLLGYREDVPELLAGSDIYVCSSRKESFGLAVVEAMSQGKPVVATLCGGPDEIVVNNETGYLVPVDDPKALAAALMKLIGSPNLRREFGETGRCRFAQNYSAKVQCSKFEDLYSSLHCARNLSTDERRLAESLIELLTRYDSENETLCDAQSYTLSAVLNSMSWRITAPLRMVYDFFRKLS